MQTQISGLSGAVARAVAVTAAMAAVVAAPALAVHPADAVYRGDAHMGKKTAVATFRVVHSHIVDFQLAGLDVLDMRVGTHGEFSGCNTRAAAHPCVRGRFTARSGVGGTVAFGRHGLWRFTAHAIGTQP